MENDSLSVADYLRSTLAIAVFFIIFLVATPIILVLLLLSLGRLTNFVVETIAPLMMKPVIAAGGVRFTVKQHGPPVEQPVVYIINHSSTLDLVTILALGLPRVRFVAKWELQYNPIFFLLGRLTGQVFIKRQKSEQAVSRLQQSYTRIRENKRSVLMAPEGSRKHPGIIGPFKKGPFRMAMALGYPIVPIYLKGNRELGSGGSLVFKSGHVSAHLHPPIDTSNWRIETLEKHIKEIRSRYLQWAGVKNDPVEFEIKDKMSREL